MKLVSYITSNSMDNVIDEFKGKSAEEIRAVLEPQRSKLVNICMNRTRDFNKSSILRSGNAFLAKELVFVGANARFDRRGTLGLHHLETVKHSETLEEVIAELHGMGYRVYGVVNSLDEGSIYDEQFPELTAFLYGEEEMPLTADDLSLCDGVVTLPQRGVLREMNPAQLAAIAMAEYHRQRLTA